MARPRKLDGDRPTIAKGVCGVDLDLEDLPAPARWRTWMGRVEAVIFASAQPILRENLARVVGKACNLDLIIDDIRDELRGRPYELVSVAGSWMFRTKLGFGEAIRAALGRPDKTELSRANALVLMAIGYFQPTTRGELSQLLGREVSRNAIAAPTAQRPAPLLGEHNREIGAEIGLDTAAINSLIAAGCLASSLKAGEQQ